MRWENFIMHDINVITNCNEVRKLYHARYKCNNKRDPKIVNLNKMATPKKAAYLLSFFSRHYHKIMKLKCKARRYLSLFSCNCVSHMTNYVNFKLNKDVEKNPGPTQYNTDHHEVIIRPFMQNHSSTMQLTSAISSENLMQSRFGELGLQSIDVGCAGDCLFISVSHQLYGNSNHPMRTYCWGSIYERQPREIYWEQKNSWLRYLNNKCIQGTWADALIIQAIADVLKVTIQIVESNQGFAPLTTVYGSSGKKYFVYNYHRSYWWMPLCINHCLTIECLHSMCNELTNDAQSSRNKHFIMSTYAVCFSVIKSCTYWDSSTLQALHEHACLFYEKCNVGRVGKMPSNITATIWYLKYGGIIPLKRL